ncbi:hypothetical protein [Vibrio metoecus]|uniref:hypothetical protein n=1 Tax=Vibrio metoecus TaxID=1481663 RepID=UPI000BA9B254|nr:hypothetical protein [Vibrio metoecus]PAR34157.1 hypothetical protein CGT97_17585 [Vibrio metoecus]PAR41199.1 hypothetical protein CGT96_16930 [Vibrio metoecus]
MSCNGDPFEPIPQAKFSERHWHSLPMDVAKSNVLPVERQTSRQYLGFLAINLPPDTSAEQYLA